jgi:hypothetical protein
VTDVSHQHIQSLLLNIVDVCSVSSVEQSVSSSMD